MSIEAINWALRVPVGGSAKVVLLGLANHAHPDGSEAYPSKHTLAIYACCDIRTAVRNVRKLQEDGWIKIDGRGPRGEAKYRLAMTPEPFPADERAGDGKLPSVAKRRGGDGTGGAKGMAPVPPEPSIEPSIEPPVVKEAAVDEFPDDLPQDLVPAALAAGKLLKRTALARLQRKQVTRAAVGHAVLTYPDRDHVKVARDLEYWLLHGRGAKKPCGDIVQRYRNFLDAADPMPGPGITVIPTTRREPTQDERRLIREARIAALKDQPHEGDDDDPYQLADTRPPLRLAAGAD